MASCLSDPAAARLAPAAAARTPRKNSRRTIPCAEHKRLVSVWLVFILVARLTPLATPRSSSDRSGIGMPPTISQKKTLYAGWLNVLGVRLRLANGDEVTREVEDHG